MQDCPKKEARMNLPSFLTLILSDIKALELDKFVITSEMGCKKFMTAHEGSIRGRFLDNDKKKKSEVNLPQKYP